MTHKSFRLAAAAMALAATSLMAQNAPAPAAPAPAAQPAVREVTDAEIDKLLAFIPAVIATYGKDQKLQGDLLRKQMRPSVKNALAHNAQITQDMLIGFANQMAENLILDELVKKDALAHGFKPDAAKAKEQFETIKKQTGEKFKELLAQSGLTEAQALERLATGLSIQAYIESLGKATEAEAKEFFDTNLPMFTKLHASHILAMFPAAKENKEPSAEEDAATLKRIQEAQKQLADGKEFAEVAKALSDCPSKEKGGDLGEFTSGQMVPEFEQALLKLKTGEITKEPVKTQFGYHIIKAGETQKMTFDEVKDKIMNHLANAKRQKATGELINKLKADANIKILLPQPKAPETPATPAAPQK